MLFLVFGLVLFVHYLELWMLCLPFVLLDNFDRFHACVCILSVFALLFCLLFLIIIAVAWCARDSPTSKTCFGAWPPQEAILHLHSRASSVKKQLIQNEQSARIAQLRQVYEELTTRTTSVPKLVRPPQTEE